MRATHLGIGRQYASLHLVHRLGQTVAAQGAERIVGAVAVVAVHGAQVPWRHHAPR